MDLLPDKILEDSPVVANCRMNRERDLRGPNGYDRDLRFDPLAFLKQKSLNQGQASWLDLCCGTGKALMQAAEIVDAEKLPIQITGVDLVAYFLTFDSKCLQLHEASLSRWLPDSRFDLITCVHGLHYIGDKVGLIGRVCSWLKKDGRFVANLDMSNLRLESGNPAGRVVVSSLRRAGIEYSFRHKLLTCRGRRELQLPFEYLGADD